MEPEGSIVFSIAGISSYAFDVFTVRLPSALAVADLTEHRHTDGVSASFNAQFLDEGDNVVFVSNRNGLSRLYQTNSPDRGPTQLPTALQTQTFFHDRPTVKNGRLYFASAHDPSPEPFMNRSAIYSTRLDTQETMRLTPPCAVELSPALSLSGDLVAVASFGSGPWKADFREVQTEIVVFRASDPSHRAVLCRRGGWPAWSGDSTVFFHRLAGDGWWSIYRADLTDGLVNTGGHGVARRITPPGLHAFTPAASHDRKYIAAATLRKGRSTRQIEIFDLKSERFHTVTELINPELDHYNPFFSPESGHLGYHRFRGAAT